MQDKRTGTSLNHQCRPLAKGITWWKFIKDLLLSYFLETKIVWVFFNLIILVLFLFIGGGKETVWHHHSKGGVTS